MAPSKEQLRRRRPLVKGAPFMGRIEMRLTRAGLVAGITAAVMASMVASDAARAQSVEEFYKGKDIRILIGAGVGGTYHLYATLASRHMRKHIPGNPTLT